MPRETKAQQALRDRERILAFFMQEMYGEIVLRKDDLFEPYKAEARAGDLVLLQAAPATEWQLSWYVEDRPGIYGGAVLQTVGTGRLCNWGNVSWRVVKRSLLANPVFWEGWARRAYETVSKALRKCDAYYYRSRGWRINGTTLIVTIGPHIFLGETHKPFDVAIENADKLTIKRARDALIAGGVGKNFEEVTCAS